MNAPISADVFDVAHEGGAGRARLELLDAFFELELAVSKWLALLGHSELASPLGQRLNLLSDHPKLETAAKNGQRKVIRDLPANCRDALRIRNAVVHSRCLHGALGNEQVIFFETIKLALACEGALIPVRIMEIDEASKTARKLASQLMNFISQNEKASTS